MATPRTRCPRCGFVQPPAADCASCGVVFARLERPRATPAKEPRPATPKAPAASPKLPAASRRSPLGPRLSLRDHALLYDQLARLLSAGVPVADGLDAIAATGRGTLPLVCRGLAASLRQGIGLGRSFAARPEIPPAEAALIEAGEAVGTLPATLAGLARRRERLVTLRGRLLTMLAYPLFLSVVSVVILAVPTWLLRGKGAFAVEVAAGLGGLALLVAFCAFAVPRLLGVAAVQRLGRRLLWRTPLLGGIYRLAVWSTWAEHMRASLEAGIVGSLALVDAARATGDPDTLVAMERASRAVEQGAGIAGAVGTQRFLTSQDLVILTSAEAAGDLTGALAGLAATHGRALENRMEGGGRVLGALLVLVLLAWVASRIVDGFTQVMTGSLDQAMEQMQHELGAPGGGVDELRKTMEKATEPLDREFPYQRP